MSKEYLKDYDNCVIYCGDDDLDVCIASIKSENNDPSLCTKIVKNNCEIINSDNFRNLIFFLHLFSFQTPIKQVKKNYL